MRASSLVVALFLLATVVGVASMGGSGPAWDKAAKYNERVGAAFLKKNYETNDDVFLLGDTGIQYAVFEEGTGQHHPTRSCQVKIHHAGKTIKDRVFEDTWKRHAPEFVTLGGVLSSWQQSLQRMVVGDIWEVYTPAAHAYGQFGVQRDDIGPNETLVFKLKLLEIQCDNPDDLLPKSYQHPKREPIATQKIKEEL